MTIDDVDAFGRQPHSVVISCEWDLNLDYLVQTIWDHLALVRVYTKKQGQHPDFSQPMILRGGASVEHFCHSIHRQLASQFKYALVWVHRARSLSWMACRCWRTAGGEDDG